MRGVQDEPIITQEIGNMADALYHQTLTCFHKKQFLRQPSTIYKWLYP